MCSSQQKERSRVAVHTHRTLKLQRQGGLHHDHRAREHGVLDGYRVCVQILSRTLANRKQNLEKRGASAHKAIGMDATIGRVTVHRVAQRRHVHAQLMLAARVRLRSG